MNDILSKIAMDNLSVDLDDETEKDVWKVKDDTVADWCLDKIRTSKSEYLRFEKVVSAKVKELQDALSKEKQRFDSESDFFKGKLFEYFNSIPKKKKTKTQESYKLPSGRLVKKYKKPKYVRQDDEIVLWLEKNDMKDYIKIKKTADWGELKKGTARAGKQVVLKDTGEIIKGITVIDQPEEFKIEI